VVFAIRSSLSSGPEGLPQASTKNHDFDAIHRLSAEADAARDVYENLRDQMNTARRTWDDCMDRLQDAIRGHQRPASVFSPDVGTVSDPDLN
jgi:hypothetical protein